MITNEQFIAALEILAVDDQITLVKHLLRKMPGKDVLDFLNSKPVVAWTRQHFKAIERTSTGLLK